MVPQPTNSYMRNGAYLEQMAMTGNVGAMSVLRDWGPSGNKQYELGGSQGVRPTALPTRMPPQFRAENFLKTTLAPKDGRPSNAASALNTVNRFM